MSEVLFNGQPCKHEYGRHQDELDNVDRCNVCGAVLRPIEPVPPAKPGRPMDFVWNILAFGIIVYLIAICLRALAYPWRAN